MYSEQYEQSYMLVYGLTLSLLELYFPAWIHESLVGM